MLNTALKDIGHLLTLASLIHLYAGESPIYFPGPDLTSAPQNKFCTPFPAWTSSSNSMSLGTKLWFPYTGSSFLFPTSVDGAAFVLSSPSYNNLQLSLLPPSPTPSAGHADFTSKHFLIPLLFPSLSHISSLEP